VSPTSNIININWADDIQIVPHNFTPGTYSVKIYGSILHTCHMAVIQLLHI